MIKSPLPTFAIKTEPHYEDQTDIFLTQRAKKLLDAASRAEKMLDILDFQFHSEDYDLRHSWNYWEDNENYPDKEDPAFWPNAFYPGKYRLCVQQKGPNEAKWPGWLKNWVGKPIE